VLKTIKQTESQLKRRFDWSFMSKMESFFQIIGGHLNQIAFFTSKKARATFRMGARKIVESSAQGRQHQIRTVKSFSFLFLGMTIKMLFCI
jgi:hypothetical protein